MTTLDISVYDENHRLIGKAKNFGEAKQIHQQHFNLTDVDLAERYAGLNTMGAYLTEAPYSAHPVFYKD